MHKANKLFNKYHMLPLQSWHFNIERCYYGFLNIFPSFQVVKQMKPIVAASSHVLGNKDVDEGEDLFGDRSHFQWPVYSLLTRLNTVKHISFKLCFYWREKKKKLWMFTLIQPPQSVPAHCSSVGHLFFLSSFHSSFVFSSQRPRPLLPC